MINAASSLFILADYKGTAQGRPTMVRSLRFQQSTREEMRSHWSGMRYPQLLKSNPKCTLINHLFRWNITPDFILLLSNCLHSKSFESGI